MTFGLKQNIKIGLQKIFSDFPEVEEVILYGSRAKGNYKPGSDVDLTFKGKNLNLKTLNKISLQIDDLFMPYSFDISVFQYIDNPDLKEHIERAGKTLYLKEFANTV